MLDLRTNKRLKLELTHELEENGFTQLETPFVVDEESAGHIYRDGIILSEELFAVVSHGEMGDVLFEIYKYKLQ